MKTIKIKEGEKTIQLNVETHQTDLSNIKISDFSFDKYLLLEITNNYLNNLLDFKGSSNLKILYLENNLVIGGTYAKNNDSGFMIQTEHKQMLLSKI
jgi:hypothetical protein